MRGWRNFTGANANGVLGLNEIVRSSSEFEASILNMFY